MTTRIALIALLFVTGAMGCDGGPTDPGDGGRSSDAEVAHDAGDGADADVHQGDAGASDGGFGSDGGSGSDAGLRDGGSPPVANPDVTIRSNHLMRGTRRWRPRGLSLVGLVLTPRVVAAEPRTVYALAQARITDGFDDELVRWRSWNVDTLRFQISQDGLDPMSGRHDARYVPLIIDTIHEATRAGFTVILSMRAHMTGEEFHDQCARDKLPCDVTLRAWRALLRHASDIGHDRRVILELFNEPLGGADNTAANWHAWRAHHQPLLNQVRMAGATNVLIVDGIRAGKFAPTAARFELNDPRNQLAYGFHPYPLYIPGRISYYRPSNWQSAFGAFCDRGHVCIATEWSTSSENSCYDSNSPTGLLSPVLGRRIQRFLHQHDMGSIVWPGDFPGAIIKDNRGTPTAWGPDPEFRCTRPGGPRRFLGMGAMIKRYFTTGEAP